MPPWSQLILNLVHRFRAKLSRWSDGPLEEWKADFVRTPVQLIDGEWAEGFVAHRTINGIKQFRRATEDEKQDLIALRMTP